MIPGDFQYQVNFVADASWRLLAMQDDNALSPSHGCFHYAYWRDKTSEFPDARFQEAGATLALLSLPMFDEARRASGAGSTAQLMGAFSASLGNLARQQYGDGSYDEWYKGERGFAATEFTTIAYGFAARFLGDRLSAGDRAPLDRIAGQAGRWLAKRDDRVKANHEAAAAAALALAWDVTGDSRFKTAAREKMDDTLRRQVAEGWFPEVGGMDLGYCSVLLDYAMVYTLVTGDDRAIAPMQRLLAFMLPLIHPDGTISPEMGICLNPYVSRLGLVLLAEHDASAAALVSFLESQPGSRRALRPYLADDLRLARWSHLPLVTALLGDRAAGIAPSLDALARRFPRGWTWADAAAVGAFHDAETHVYVSAAGGGVVRAFRGQTQVCEDRGLAIERDDAIYAGSGYDTARHVARTREGVAITCPLGRARFFQPGFVSRLVLRIGSSTALGSRLLRAAIDYVRIKRRTAGNQSAAPVARGDSKFRFDRTVTVTASEMRIDDQLTSEGEAIDPAHVRRLTASSGGAATLPAPVSARVLTFSTTCDLTSGPVSTHDQTADASEANSGRS